MARVTIVVATDRDGVIGAGGRLPWHLPADLRRFRAITTGHPIVMGRRTYESIGRPLPHRHNIVISSDPAFDAPGCTVVRSLAQAYAAAGEGEVFVIGGARVYAEALAGARRIHLTLVHGQFAGDVRFPAFDRAQWVQTAREEHPADDRNAWACSFLTLERR
ncbi:MAG: dihydrofolate reductase [Gammaproteobacteria bacterium]